jgi:hypothetical protein
LSKHLRRLSWRLILQTHSLPADLYLAYFAFFAKLAQMASARSTFLDAIGDAAPSTERLHAWPSLSQAAQMLDVSLSALSRAMDAEQIPKHRLGRRVRKIEPVSLLDLAVEYGADVAKVADDVMTIAEHSGVAEPLITATEQDMGAWFAGRAMRAAGPHEDQLLAVIDAIRDTVGIEAADTILARAGVTAPDAAALGRSPSQRPR